jgi:hypothetical protein
MGGPVVVEAASRGTFTNLLGVVVVDVVEGTQVYDACVTTRNGVGSAITYEKLLARPPDILQYAQ